MLLSLEWGEPEAWGWQGSLLMSAATNDNEAPSQIIMWRLKINETFTHLVYVYECCAAVCVHLKYAWARECCLAVCAHLVYARECCSAVCAHLVYARQCCAAVCAHLVYVREWH
jgi:hypothetical protein